MLARAAMVLDCDGPVNNLILKAKYIDQAIIDKATSLSIGSRGLTLNQDELPAQTAPWLKIRKDNNDNDDRETYGTSDIYITNPKLLTMAFYILVKNNVALFPGSQRLSYENPAYISTRQVMVKAMRSLVKEFDTDETMLNFESTQSIIDTIKASLDSAENSEIKSMFQNEYHAYCQLEKSKKPAFGDWLADRQNKSKAATLYAVKNNPRCLNLDNAKIFLVDDKKTYSTEPHFQNAGFGFIFANRSANIPLTPAQIITDSSYIFEMLLRVIPKEKIKYDILNSINFNNADRLNFLSLLDTYIANNMAHVKQWQQAYKHANRACRILSKHILGTITRLKAKAGHKLVDDKQEILAEAILQFNHFLYKINNAIEHTPETITENDIDSYIQQYKSICKQYLTKPFTKTNGYNAQRSYAAAFKEEWIAPFVNAKKTVGSFFSHEDAIYTTHKTINMILESVYCNPDFSPKQQPQSHSSNTVQDTMLIPYDLPGQFSVPGYYGSTTI